jgi:hypothetical protein
LYVLVSTVEALSDPLVFLVYVHCLYTGIACLRIKTIHYIFIPNSNLTAIKIIPQSLKYVFGSLLIEPVLF